MRMIERVARSICAVSCSKEPKTIDEFWVDYVPEAKAAIEAMREPSELMVTAGRKTCITTREQSGRVYSSMIDAALSEAPNAND